MRNLISAKVANIPPSGLRRFFDIAATMKDIISLGIGEPDFMTPPQVIRAGVDSLGRGETHYTSNSGTVELRRTLSGYLRQISDKTRLRDDDLVARVNDRRHRQVECFRHAHGDDQL